MTHEMKRINEVEQPLEIKAGGTYFLEEAARFFRWDVKTMRRNADNFRVPCWRQDPSNKRSRRQFDGAVLRAVRFLLGDGNDGWDEVKRRLWEQVKIERRGLPRPQKIKKLYA